MQLFLYKFILFYFRTANLSYGIDQDSQVEYVTFKKSANGNEPAQDSIKWIVQETDGILCDFNEVMSKITYLDNKRRRRVPWNADLQIGSGLVIKIGAYIYVRTVDCFNFRYSYKIYSRFF